MNQVETFEVTSTKTGNCLSALPKVAEQMWEEKDIRRRTQFKNTESFLSPLTGPKVR